MLFPIFSGGRSVGRGVCVGVLVRLEEGWLLLLLCCLRKLEKLSSVTILWRALEGWILARDAKWGQQ